MKRLLVTGVTGFIGSDVLARLIKDERTSKITVLARQRPDREKSLLARRFKEHGIDTALWNQIEWIEVSFEDAEQFRAALDALSKQDTWRILHMAAIIKASKNNANVERLNIGVTQDLLNFANSRGAAFHYMSSMAAFGTSNSHRVRTEIDFADWEAHNDASSYYASKRRAHEWVVKEAKVPGWLYCPSVVHGSLEGSKNSRSHLAALRDGSLRWAPSGGLNIVALEDVSGPIAETLLSGLLDGVTPRARLLVGPNLRLVDYFNFYLDIYREFLALRDPARLEAIPGKMVPMMPRWLGLAAGFVDRALGTVGLQIHALDALAQSTRYLYFDSIYREGAALPDIDDLKRAIRASFDNP